MPEIPKKNSICPLCTKDIYSFHGPLNITVTDLSKGASIVSYDYCRCAKKDRPSTRGGN